MTEPQPTIVPVHVLALQAGLRNVLVDRVTAEVSEAFSAREIPSIVLKGPAIATWLYGRDEVRAYDDSDLLVRRQDWERAGAVLEGLGFENDLSIMAHPRMESFASDPWLRGADNLDLHCTVYGLNAPFDVVWDVLSADTAPLTIAGRELQILGEPGRAMHVALHAAQHQEGKPAYDLRKAMAQLPEDTWWAAASVAARCDGLAAFASGLRLVEGGEALVSRMGIGEIRTASMELRASRIPLSESLNELWETPGARGKLRVAISEIFPRPAFMRWWSPMARRGRTGLVAAYLWRPLYLLLKAPPAALAVFRARRKARRRAG